MCADLLLDLSPCQALDVLLAGLTKNPNRRLMGVRRVTINHSLLKHMPCQCLCCPGHCAQDNVFLNSFDFALDRSNRPTKEQAEDTATLFRATAGDTAAPPTEVCSPPCHDVVCAPLSGSAASLMY